MDRIDLVLPCFNEEAGLPAFVERLQEVLPGIATRHSVQFRLIFVDDGSQDGTVEVLKQLCLDWPSEIVILSRNFGKEAALSAGIDVVDGDAAILLDVDLQHPPERIEDLIEHWRQGYEVVYFYKRDRMDEGFGKRVLSRVFYRLINRGAPVEIPANAGDFRLLSDQAVEAMRMFPERERFLKGLFAWIGFKQFGLPFDVPDRHDGGPSRFNPARLTALAISGLTSFSIAPIRIMTLAGMWIAALSILYVIWIIAEWFLWGAPFSGFASIVVLVTFFGGLQMACLGLIGEYVGKAVVEVKARPLYILRERIPLVSRK